MQNHPRSCSIEKEYKGVCLYRGLLFPQYACVTVVRRFGNILTIYHRPRPVADYTGSNSPRRSRQSAQSKFPRCLSSRQTHIGRPFGARVSSLRLPDMRRCNNQYPPSSIAVVEVYNFIRRWAIRIFLNRGVAL